MSTIFLNLADCTHTHISLQKPTEGAALMTPLLFQLLALLDAAYMRLHGALLSRL